MRNTIRTIICAILAAFILASCNPSVPAGKPDGKEERVMAPSWLQDKVYRNGNSSMHFNENGIPNIATDGDIRYTKVEKDRVELRIAGKYGESVHIITRDSSNRVHITVDGTDFYLDTEAPGWLHDRTFENLENDAGFRTDADGFPEFGSFVVENQFITFLSDDEVRFEQIGIYQDMVVKTSIVKLSDTSAMVTLDQNGSVTGPMEFIVSETPSFL